MWKICQNALPVRDNLFRRQLITSPLYLICGSEKETIEHALLLCSWTRQVWFGSQLQINPSFEIVTRIDLWLQGKFALLLAYPDYKETGLALLANILWGIWKGRNNFTFNQKKLNLFIIITQACFLTWECSSLPRNDSSSSTSSRSQILTKVWRPPSLGQLKCNVDASFCSNHKVGAVVAIIRDCRGALVAGSALRIP